MACAILFLAKSTELFEVYCIYCISPKTSLPNNIKPINNIINATIGLISTYTPCLTLFPSWSLICSIILLILLLIVFNKMTGHQKAKKCRCRYCYKYYLKIRAHLLKCRQKCRNKVANKSKSKKQISLEILENKFNQLLIKNEQVIPQIIKETPIQCQQSIENLQMKQNLIQQSLKAIQLERSQQQKHSDKGINWLIRTIPSVYIQSQPISYLLMKMLGYS